jgi:hypothetical protein
MLAEYFFRYAVSMQNMKSLCLHRMKMTPMSIAAACCLFIAMQKLYIFSSQSERFFERYINWYIKDAEFSATEKDTFLLQNFIHYTFAIMLLHFAIMLLRKVRKNILYHGITL